MDWTDTNLPADQVDRINASKIAHVEKNTVMRTFIIRMNNTKPPFDNLNARKAFAHAFNYMGFITDILGGYATRDPYADAGNLVGLSEGCQGLRLRPEEGQGIRGQGARRGRADEAAVRDCMCSRRTSRACRRAQLFQSDLARDRHQPESGAGASGRT